MCDVALPLNYETITIYPNSNPGWLGSDASCLMAVSMAALAASFLIGLIALWMMRRREIIGSKSPIRRTSAIMAVGFCALVGTSGFALAEASPELNVYGPHDNIISEGQIKEISENYSNQYNVPVNITCVNGRKALLKMLSDKGAKVDVVILEEEYPLYNLTGMKSLKKKGLVENYSYLYSENALMIVRVGSGIASLDDLKGKSVAVTDQHVPGGCLARDIINATGLNVTKVSVQSTEAQLDAVAGGMADATVLWESMFNTYANRSSDEIEAVDLPEYRMDNFIAVLKCSLEKELAEGYADYLLKSLSENNIGAKAASNAASKAEA